MKFIRIVDDNPSIFNPLRQAERCSGLVHLTGKRKNSTIKAFMSVSIWPSSSLIVEMVHFDSSYFNHRARSLALLFSIHIIMPPGTVQNKCNSRRGEGMLFAFQCNKQGSYFLWEINSVAALFQQLYFTLKIRVSYSLWYGKMGQNAIQFTLIKHFAVSHNASGHYDLQYSVFSRRAKLC